MKILNWNDTKGLFCIYCGKILSAGDIEIDPKQGMFGCSKCCKNILINSFKKIQSLIGDNYLEMGEEELESDR